MQECVHLLRSLDYYLAPFEFIIAFYRVCVVWSCCGCGSATIVHLKRVHCTICLPNDRWPVDVEMTSRFMHAIHHLWNKSQLCRSFALRHEPKRLSCWVTSTHGTDKQTDRQTSAMLYAASPWVCGIIQKVINFVLYSFVFSFFFVLYFEFEKCFRSIFYSTTL